MRPFLTLPAIFILAMVGFDANLPAQEKAKQGERKEKSVLVAQQKTASTAKRPEEGEEERHLTHCPVYPIAFHGTYTTYYALHYDPSHMPPCYDPIYLDAGNNLPLGCPGAGCQKTRTDKDRKHGHRVAQKLAEDGSVAYGTESKFNKGAYDLNQHTGARVIQFERDSQTHLVRVYWVLIVPKYFDASQMPGGTNPWKDENPIVTGFGYEIKAGSAKPTHEPEKCQVQPIGEKYLKVTVEIRPGEHRDYRVILK